jgi:UDP-N-acetyl-D-mannosaminuronate dehydrogenase
MIKNEIGVIGIGEIGKAIVEIAGKKFVVCRKDLDFAEIGERKLDYLHICIPYSEEFLSVVVEAVKKYQPKLTVIHSTIAVGVTRNICKITKSAVIHSPVRGDHPHLARDIKRFTKFIGAIDSKSANFAKRHLSEMGVKDISLLESPEETELGKLLDTTYFAWNVIFCKLVGRLCNELNLDYENVYTKFNETYNKGYKTTKPYVTRPVLKYVHERDKNGGIGGHCLMENAQILDGALHLSITKFLIEQNEEIKKTKK